MKTVKLDGFKKNVERVIVQAMRDADKEIQIPHIFMNLQGKKEQKEMTEYITSVLQKYKCRTFHGLDDFLEYRLDGRNTKWVFDDILDHAVYTNAFEGVVAIDVSALSEYVKEDPKEIDYFAEQIQVVSEQATVIIYYNLECYKRIHIVKERIHQVVEHTVEIWNEIPEGRKELFVAVNG